MKIAYIYPSSPEIEYPEIPSLPPLPAIICIACEEVPYEISVAMNIGIVDIPKCDPYYPYTIYVKILFEGNEIVTPETQSVSFRHKAFTSPDGLFAMRHSYIEKFTIEKYGTYTFCASLYDRDLTEKPEDEDGLVHRAECSIVIAKDWR